MICKRDEVAGLVDRQGSDPGSSDAGRCFQSSLLSHALSLQLNAIGVVDEAVEDRIVVGHVAISASAPPSDKECGLPTSRSRERRLPPDTLNLQAVASQIV